jgi:8-oxo-dGTP pyrophosphatase MutT (NUDIX family)
VSEDAVGANSPEQTSGSEGPASGIPAASEPDEKNDMFALLDEVRAIARTGLHYSDNPFDRARYERLLELAAQGYAERTGLDPHAVRARFDAEIGYQTARVGADAAVFDEAGRVLLVHRVDDGKWGLIAGWVDPNESPAATAVRELEEEVGAHGRVDGLVGVFFRAARAGEHPHGIVSIVYLCSIEAGELRPQRHEVSEIAWRHIDDVSVDDWHLHHERLARAAQESYWRARGGI